MFRPFSSPSALAAISACVLFALAPAPARAEGPLSLALQAVIPSGNGGGTLGGATQLGAGLGYDFGPPIVLPVRATAQFDYNGGSANGGHLSTYGFTLGARLMTPLYAGIGIGPYVTSYSYSVGPFPLYMPALVGATPYPRPIFLPPPPTTSATSVGFGTKFTVGDRILSLPGGVSLSLEASYQLLPTINGIDPSAARLGLRLHI